MEFPNFNIFFADYINNMYTLQKIKSNREKYKKTCNVLLPRDAAKLFHAGKEKDSWSEPEDWALLQEDIEVYREPEREIKHESNRVLKQKYLSSSKAHISLNDTKQAVNVYSIANMCNFSTGTQA